MPVHRKNKSARVLPMYLPERWFSNNLRRQRKRNKIARRSRAINRKIQKGKRP